MSIVRRNPFQVAVGTLLGMALIVGAVVATGSMKRAAAACNAGYGYGYDPNNPSGVPEL